MSTDDTGSATGRTRPPKRRRGWIRNAPIRTKLAMIIAVPLATVLVLGGLQVADTVQQARQAAQLRELVAVSASSAALVDSLQHERLDAVDVVLSKAGESVLRVQARATDAALRRYRADTRGVRVTAGLADSLDNVDDVLDTLDTLRSQVTAQHAEVSSVVLRYEIVISALTAYRENVAQNTNVAGTGNAIRAAALFSDAKQDVAFEQAVAYAGLSAGQFGGDERQTFLGALHGQEQALVSFLDSATTGQQQLVRTAVAGDAVELAQRVTSQLSHGRVGDVGVSADEVRSALGALVDLMRFVEMRLDAGVTDEVITHENDTIQRAVLDGSVVAVAILLAMLLVVALARRMSRSLRELRRAADSVANRDLPQAVAQLRDASAVANSSPAELSQRSYRPVPVTSTDEVGQVAHSFNGVQREAVRIAIEQAMLRANVSATFISVARRSQKFVDRLIASLDQVERNEEHPERLAQLFELDHLATRMRRNDENLLILAEADAATPRAEDAALSDVLAAAQSEIARYERVRLGPLNLDGQSGEAVMVHAEAVNNVVRLFAELLENAANFSPPDRYVQVTARRVGDQTLVEIEDHGIGMTQERRDELNERLADPGATGLGSVRMMGFAVVARLAARYNIRVHLGSGRYGGTVAHVVLPPGLITRHRSRPSPVPITDHPEPSLGAPPGIAGPPPYPPRRPEPVPQEPATLGWYPSGGPEQRPDLPTRGSRFAAQSGTPREAAASWSAPAEPARPEPARPEPAEPTDPFSPAAAAPAAESATNEWFSSRTVRPGDGDEPVREGRHAAHPGWQAAARATEPQVSAETTTGLPRRAPMAQLVPGGFDTKPVEISRTATGVRSFLAEYQRGVNNGRDRAVRQPGAGVASGDQPAEPDTRPRRPGES